MSVKFLSAILGPEMAAPIVWAPGKCVLSAGKTHVHKIIPFRGGYFGFLGGDPGSADFISWDFSDKFLKDMKEKTPRTGTHRLGLELPDILLPDTRKRSS